MTPQIVSDSPLVASNNSVASDAGLVPSHTQRRSTKLRPGLHVRLRFAKGHTPRNVLRRPVRFPAAIGGEFTVEEEFRWEEINTTGAGDFMIPPPGENPRNLQKWTNEALTMTWDPRWMANLNISPKWFIKQMRKVGREHAPFHMLILNKPNPHYVEYAGLAVLTRMAVVLRRGEPDTRYLNFDFSQYRPLTVGRKMDPRLPTTHELKENDSLRSLAEKFYGSGKWWREIKRANGIGKVGQNEKLVKLPRFEKGDRIKIPAKPEIHIGKSINESRSSVAESYSDG